jgi:hypothetical protein
MCGTLEKDPAVIRTLDRLWSCLGADAFQVVDHWECDLTAIGIARPSDHGVLVYFEVRGDTYNVELELPPGPCDDFPYQIAAQHWMVDFETLLRAAADHLNRA